MNPSATKKSPYTGHEPNTVKIVTNTLQFCSGKPEFELTAEDLESGQDSTIMIRERHEGQNLKEPSRKEREHCWKTAIILLHSYQRAEQHQQ